MVVVAEGAGEEVLGQTGETDATGCVARSIDLRHHFAIA